MTWDVQTVDRLSAEALVALRAEEVAAVRIADYCTADAAARIATLLADHPERTNYQARWAHAGSDGIQLGNAFSTTDTDRVGAIDTTPSGSGSGPNGPLATIRAVRDAAAPHLGPIDRLRLELDEIAPRGARLNRDNGRVSLSGVGRVMERSDEVIHADTGRRNCLTANVYLRMPKQGGGTRIWKYDGEYRTSPQSYKFAADEIPPSAPSCLLEPRECDLVIWNPALPHAVQAFEQGPRVTLQTWLLFEAGSPAEPADFAVRLLN